LKTIETCPLTRTNTHERGAEDDLATGVIIAQ